MERPTDAGVASHLQEGPCGFMISASTTNLRKNVWTSRGGALVQFNQSIAKRFRFLPLVTFQKFFSFRSCAEPCSSIVGVEQWWTIAIRSPVSQIKLRQNEHDRYATFSRDLL